MNKMQSHDLTVDHAHAKLRLHYTEWGEPDNPDVVVCAHGLTRNSRDFDAVANALAQHFRVLCPDVAGRGSSDWLPQAGDYHYGTYTSHMAQFAAQTVGPACRIHWLGTSMGGLIGLLLAANFAEHTAPYLPITSLILNDVGAVIPQTALERIAQYVGMKTIFSSETEWEAHLRTVSAGFGPLTDAQWQHLARHSCFMGDDGFYHPAYDPKIAEPFKRDLSTVDLTPFWEKVSCPTLILRGEHSDILSAETVCQMQTRPGTTVTEIKGTGHAPMLMDPAQINFVANFFREHRDP